ncbi:hypothetical protein M0R45_035927 [Rubus argutus]|uniref:START domain-containing protein n=1 Tax=Rubus argutus TaxID=59490 RepID=A0AAW1VZ41_RUBAR
MKELVKEIEELKAESNPHQRFTSRQLSQCEVLFRPQRGGVAPYFQSEALRHSTTIRVNPITIVQTLMDVDQWLHSSVAWSLMLRSWRSCPLEKKRATRRGRKVMSAEFVLPTPKVPAREAQFVRYSHQQLDGSWIVVDVSVDEWRQFQRPSTRLIFRKRPSRCLIQDMQNGSSFVTWVENVDVRDKTKELHPKLIPIVESGFAFGARRWDLNSSSTS